MKYNPKIHHRRSIRLKGYDYSQAGLYFVTICCQDRECLFGKIVGAENFLPEMVLNDAGKIANECWLKIPEHFPNAVLHEYIIMPNHVHGIIELTETVGANQHSPETNTPETNNNAVMANQYSPETNGAKPETNGAKNVSPLRSPSKTIGSIVRGYKIGVTKWFRTNADIKNVWQRNYYEHIIRDEQSYQRIAEYIVNNPEKWQADKFYMQ